MAFPHSAFLIALAVCVGTSAGAIGAAQAQEMRPTPVRNAPETAADGASAQVSPVTAAAAPAAPEADLAVSLNTLAPSGGGCRLSFVVHNATGTEIADLGLEVAVFGTGGGLDRLLRLGFGPLLEGKTRVKQFDLADMACEDVGRVLVNDVVRCDGEGLTPLTCLRRLSARSDAATPFGL